MNIIKLFLFFEYFVLTVCGLRVTDGPVSFKSYTIWGKQNDDQTQQHTDQSDHLMETRSKRSLFECGVNGQNSNVNILSDIALPGQCPWLIALFRSSYKVLTYQCGASLIDNRFAITAAECVYNRYAQKQMEAKDFAVIVGTTNVSRQAYTGDNTRFLTAIYVHEEYDSESYINNIALLVLKERVICSTLVKSVCLWETKYDQDDLEKAIRHGTVDGWGEIDRVMTLEAPQRFNVSIISLTSCRGLNTEHANMITEKTFCAVTEGTKTFCRGLSGSGLYIEHHGHWILRGVVSLAILIDGTCSTTNIYTDVAKYKNWISVTAYRWSQKNVMPVAASTHASGIDLSWYQQCSKRDDVNTLVTGGQSTREGEWPWHVAIYHNEHMGSSSLNRYKCGGSLISALHVLTAAHCFIDKLTNRPVAKSSINIYLGTHNIKSFSVAVQFKLVDRLKIHPEYSPQTQYKDIAVLKLSGPVEFTGAVRPVCLWPEDEVDLSNVVGKNGSVVGWGNDEFGLLADELVLAELPVVSELMCLRSNIFYHKYTNNFTFCAGQLRDTSVCNGDSGGGMVFKLRSGAGTEIWFLRGIVSLRRVTDKPCDPSSYIIFTDVAKYIDWIKDFISRDL